MFTMCKKCDTIVPKGENGGCKHCEQTCNIDLELFSTMRTRLSEELYNINAEDSDVRLHYMYVYNSLQYFTKMSECSKKNTCDYYYNRALKHIDSYINKYGSNPDILHLLGALKRA